MGIVGTKEVVVKLRFAVPPGTDTTAAAGMVSSSGVMVSLGLIPFFKGADVEIHDTQEPPKLTVE
jgi:hypothetical protein